MGIKILYIGNDERYFKSLGQEFKDFYDKEKDVSFITCEDSSDNFHGQFEFFLETAPDITFLDFSSQEKARLNLMRMICAVNQDHTYTVVSLFGQLQEEKMRNDLMNLSLEAGILVNQIKSGGDFFDPIYNAMRIAFPAKVIEPKFAEVKSNEGIDSEILDICRLNFISKEFIECEGNLSLEEGTVLHMKWPIPQELSESTLFEVKGVSEGDNYFRRIYKLRVSPILLDPVPEITSTEPIEIAEYKDKCESREKKLIEDIIPLYHEWIADNVGNSETKNVKIALIDHHLTLLKDNPDVIDNSNFSFRVVSYYQSAKEYILNYNPDIITFQINSKPPDPEPEEAEVDENGDEIAAAPVKQEEVEEIVELFNDNEVLSEMISDLNAKGVEPYIVVFGGDKDTASLRSEYGYNKLLSYPEDTTIGNILGLGATYEKKKLEEIEKAREEIYIPAKTEPISTLYIPHPIKIMHLTECTIVFTSKSEIKENSFFYVDSPVKIMFTVLKHKENSQWNMKDYYVGVIHSTMNTNKKALRQFLIKNK